MITLDRDDKVHLCVAGFASLFAMLAGCVVKYEYDAHIGQSKIYDCFCYVISNRQEYGCIDAFIGQNLNVTWLCAKTNNLYHSQEYARNIIAFGDKIMTGYLIILGIAIAVLFLKPCARCRGYRHD